MDWTGFVLSALLAASPSAAGAPFLAWCEALELSERVQVDGPDGDVQLDACLFSASKSSADCARLLRVLKADISRIRARKGDFAIVGNPMCGFSLAPSNAYLSRLQGRGAEPYLEIVRAQDNLVRLQRELSTARFLQASKEHVARGGAPFQWGGAAPQVSPEQVDDAANEYAMALENRAQRERDAHLRRCLSRELRALSPSLDATSEGRARAALRARGAALERAVRSSMRLGEGWSVTQHQTRRLAGFSGEAPVLLFIFEGPSQTHERRPWFAVALAAHDGVLTPSPSEQPASSDPEKDGQPFAFVGSNESIRVFAKKAQTCAVSCEGFEQMLAAIREALGLESLP